MVKRQEVKSTQIKEVAYDYDTGIMYVRFHRSDWYSYDGVAADIYEELAGNKSPGSYFHKAIKGSYDYQKCQGLTPWDK